MSININVVNRKGDAVCNFKADATMLVDDLRKLFLKTANKKLDVNRVRLEI